MLNSQKRSRIIGFCILYFAIYILIWGCFNPFSPSVIGPSALKPIAPQVDPDSVLYNFKYAYENRDSIVYENCLDEDFIFTYWDQLKVGEAIVETEFYLSEDIKVTKALFRTFEDIKLDKWKVNSAPDTNAGQEIWKIRNVEFHLSVRDIDGEYQSMEANGYAEFFFRQSNKDNLWRIVHWIDNSNR
jgi:hydroxymethylpyrimidine pyrophosphatase-like HAD family hydrolase